MAITIIMAFTILAMWGALVFTYGKTSVENGKYLLGITLPVRLREEPEVRDVMVSYKRDNARLHRNGFLMGAALLLLSDFMSIQVPLLLVWYCALIWYYQENVKKHAIRLYELKKEKGWLTGSPHVIHVDTALSSMKDRGVLSWKWFLPAWVLSFLGILSGGNRGFRLDIWDVLVILLDKHSHFALMLCTQSVFLFIWYCVKEAKPQVYCSDSKINQKVDRAVRFEWSRCAVVHAWGMALLLCWNGMLNRGNDADQLTVMISVGTVGALAIWGWAWYKVRRCRDQAMGLAAAKEAELYGDDDVYWLYGYPPGYRARGMAEKRIGVGWTAVDSLQPGKVDYLIYGILIAVAAGIFLFFMPYDFAKVRVNVKSGEESSCEVQVCFQQRELEAVTFLLEDVEAVILVEKRPSMSKKSGLDSNRFWLGDFRVSGYGTCEVVLHVKNDTAVYVDLKEGQDLWFNGETPEETQKIYEELVQAFEMQ